MVTQVTSFSRNGVSDWLVQRVSAVILAAYTVVVVGYVLLVPEMSWFVWSGLFSQTWMQVFTLVTLLATCAHAWVGMWTIGTDYLRTHTMGQGANLVRFTYEIFCILVTLVYLIWGIRILWGNG